MYYLFNVLNYKGILDCNGDWCMYDWILCSKIIWKENNWEIKKNESLIYKKVFY